MKPFLFVGLGGAAGSIARYGVSLAFARLPTNTYPLSTLSINLIGSLLIGVFFGLFVKGTAPNSQNMLLLLATGLCGGFTTFSAFALENINLMQRGQTSVALAYSIISVAGGLLCCKVGLWIVG
ncbi:MAG: fluoride efflux transporter CrcB [Taibaiella sp.]|nr:fluoride efflux transporter CrcB [Taibaiella sp.]